MKKINRIISAFLCLVIVLSYPGFSALASDVKSDESPDSSYADISENKDKTDGKDLGENKENTKSDKPELAETKLEGLKTYYNKRYDNSTEFNVKISPSNPARKVRLQLYDSKKKKFKTVKTFKTKKAKKSKLKISIPKKYKKKTSGTWRIVVDKSKNADKYISPKFVVTTRNLKNVKLNAKSACVYCVETGQVLYGKDMYTKRKQASTTKIMTAVLLIESGKLDDNVKITKSVANTPYGNVYFKAGDVYCMHDLLYSMLLPSSNDSAAAIAYGVSKSQTEFVKLMNKRAKELGLNHTVYGNAHGLDTRNNGTTAYELALLTAHASGYDEFMDAVSRKTYSFNSVRYHKHKKVRTTDKIKSYTKRHLGGKTGYTSKAKYCYSSVYKYKGETLCCLRYGK